MDSDHHFILYCVFIFFPFFSIRPFSAILSNRFLAPVLEAVAEAKPDRIKLIGESLGLTFAEDADLDAIKSATGDTIRTLCKELGLSTLKELIPEKDIPVISQQVMNDVGIFVSPIPMDAKKVETIIQSEYEKSCK